jgi:hypothetical protein
MGKAINKEFMVNFADGQGTFINEITISDNIKFEEREGFLYCDNAILGHTGVQKYYDREMGGLTNKIVKVNKFREDLLSDESIETIKGKSITRGHPRDSDGKIQFVDGKNFKQLELGTVINAWRDGDNMLGKLVIKDPDAIIDILAGDLKSLSLGYSAKVEPFGDGEFKQCDFYFNHLAIVGKGRAVNAMIVDEDTIGKEKLIMPINKELLDKIQSGDAKVSEDGKFVEFVDEKHITKRIRISEEETVYDYETGEEVFKTKIQETVINKTVEGKDELKDPFKQIGDKDTIDEKTGNKTETDLVKELELARKSTVEKKVVTGDEKTVEELEEEKLALEKIELDKKIEKDKEFGDTDMNEAELKKFKADTKAEIIADLKVDRPDVFADLDPLHKDEPKKGFKLDFKKNEMLKKEMWDKATNPVRHDGDWLALQKTRKQLFN